MLRGESGEGGVFGVHVAGADGPNRGLVLVPQPRQALAEGGVPTRAVRPSVGPVGDERVDPGLDPVACDAQCGGPGQDPHAGSTVGRNRARRIGDAFGVSCDKRGSHRDDVDSLTVL